MHNIAKASLSFCALFYYLLDNLVFYSNIGMITENYFTNLSLKSLKQTFSLIRNILKSILDVKKFFILRNLETELKEEINKINNFNLSKYEEEKQKSFFLVKIKEIRSKLVQVKICILHNIIRIIIILCSLKVDSIFFFVDPIIHNLLGVIHSLISFYKEICEINNNKDEIEKNDQYLKQYGSVLNVSMDISHSQYNLNKFMKEFKEKNKASSFNAKNKLRNGYFDDKADIKNSYFNNKEKNYVNYNNLGSANKIANDSCNKSSSNDSIKKNNKYIENHYEKENNSHDFVSNHSSTRDLCYRSNEEQLYFVDERKESKEYDDKYPKTQQVAKSAIGGNRHLPCNSTGRFNIKIEDLIENGNIISNDINNKFNYNTKLPVNNKSSNRNTLQTPLNKEETPNSNNTILKSDNEIIKDSGLKNNTLTNLSVNPNISVSDNHKLSYNNNNYNSYLNIQNSTINNNNINSNLLNSMNINNIKNTPFFDTMSNTTLVTDFSFKRNPKNKIISQIDKDNKTHVTKTSYFTEENELKNSNNRDKYVCSSDSESKRESLFKHEGMNNYEEDNENDLYFVVEGEDNENKNDKGFKDVFFRSPQSSNDYKKKNDE